MIRSATVLFASAVALIPVARAQEWGTDFAAAQAAAKKDNKVILANFTGSDWCGWCIKLKDEVFSKPEFQEWAKDKVVLLELDYPRNKQLPAELKQQNDELKQRFGIRGYPTILFLDAEGKQVGKSGYVPGGPEAWIEKAEQQLQTSSATSAWTTDYEAALKQAKKEKKIVLANFTGSDWCGWCIKLKDEVFSKPEFQEWAADNVVLLELDFPRNKQLPDEVKKQNEKLRDEHQIQGYPTILFLDAKGKKIGQSGYEQGGPEAWIAAAEKEAGIKSKRKPKGKDKDKGKEKDKGGE